MDKGKIITIILILLFHISCSDNEKFNLNRDKIIFKYSKFITVDFEEAVITVRYGNSLYSDSCNISASEYSLIINSYNSNKIYEIKGESSYPDCIWIMPSFEDRIEIFVDKRLKSAMYINTRPDCIPKKVSTSSSEYRVIQFRNDIFKVLKDNADFKKAMDTLGKYKKQERILFI